MKTNTIKQPKKMDDVQARRALKKNKCVQSTTGLKRFGPKNGPKPLVVMNFSRTVSEQNTKCDVQFWAIKLVLGNEIIKNMCRIPTFNPFTIFCGTYSIYFLIIELHPYQLPLSTGANEASVFFSCENETYTWCSIQLENTQMDSHETMEEYLMARNTNNNKKSEKSLDIKCGSVYATSMHVGQ